MAKIERHHRKGVAMAAAWRAKSGETYRSMASTYQQQRIASSSGAQQKPQTAWRHRRISSSENKRGVQTS